MVVLFLAITLFAVTDYVAVKCFDVVTSLTVKLSLIVVFFNNLEFFTSKILKTAFPSILALPLSVTSSKLVTCFGFSAFVTPIALVVIISIKTFSTPELLFISVRLLLSVVSADKLTGLVVRVKSIFAWI